SPPCPRRLVALGPKNLLCGLADNTNENSLECTGGAAACFRRKPLESLDDTVEVPSRFVWKREMAHSSGW
ncbi:MAG TPA: hypothetical protein VF969_00085, partial [Burkholderiales bacterium]